MLLARILLAFIILWTFPAKAHEFWIEPQSYMISSKDSIVADVRNGQIFAGNSLSYVPNDYARFELNQDETITKIDPIIGTRPAISVESASDGLAILVAQTNTAFASYKEWTKFQKFIDHKDFNITQKDHLAEGFPPDQFKESYRRFSKSLVGIGSGKGQDKVIGLEIELVALKNPYTDDTTGGLPVQAFYQDSPLANVQIELFEKNADQEVTVTLHRTNEQGIVNLPIKSGHSYLVDTVLLRKASEDANNVVVWDTLWASLTFAKT